MREATFLKRNKNKWLKLEKVIQGAVRANPDEVSEMFIELTDDLSYARTFYPGSNTEKYLNNLSFQAHQKLYKNKKERSNRFVEFWKTELPLLVRQYHKTLLISFLFFAISASVGALSAAYDQTFVRLILGDAYVEKTLDNIEQGKPMAIYNSGNEVDMFLGITFNNINVSFRTFILGILLSFGTALMLLYNGIMLGSFEYFFY